MAIHRVVQVVDDDKPPEIAPLPKSIRNSIFVVFFVLYVGATAFVWWLGVLWYALAFLGYTATVREVRMLRHRRLERPPRSFVEKYAPPLLTDEELAAKMEELATPKELPKEMPPIPLPELLRDRAWARWREKSVQPSPVRIRPIADYVMMGPEDQEKFKFFKERMGHTQKVLTAIRESGPREQQALASQVVDLENLIVICQEGMEGLVGKNIKPTPLRFPARRTAIPALPQFPALARPFKAETDCEAGHVGFHNVGELFTSHDGVRRVQRSCRWCESAWSELV